MNRSGPPDPNAKPIAAPLQIEVCVGLEDQFRRAYAEPTRSEEVEINGLQVTVETEVFEPMYVTRYVFRHPRHEQVSVSVMDMLSGFPDRVAGAEALAKLLPDIVATVEFDR
jgi:hypothetical protein